MERGVWWLMAYGPWGSQSIGHNWVTNTVKLQNNCKETGNFLGSKNLYLDVNECARMWSSVQFSHSVMSDSLRPHESQHARPPCPSPTPGVHPNPYPLSQWCHPTISSSVIPFSSCLQSLPASECFPMSQLFAWGSQSIGVSASASVLPMNTQDWSPLGWTGWYIRCCVNTQ